MILRANILVDFSSPNIAKEMHVGHLRSTIIGESLCNLDLCYFSLGRIFEFVQHKVERVSHIGDWGTQFGMLIEYFKLVDEKDYNISDLTTFYKNAKKKFEEDEKFKKSSQLAVLKLQAGDEQTIELWNKICDKSREYFTIIYDKLNINVQEVGESFYNKMIPETINELKNKNLVDISEGATCMFTQENRENYVPLMLLKSDGGYGYDTTDVAAIRYRLIQKKKDWVIYITDAGQSQHFQKLFACAHMAGWLNENNKCDHIGFGLVLGEDGKKFKTRSGDTVKLLDLLDEAVTRSYKEIENRQSNDSSTISDYPDKYESASKIGYSAIKYFDLKTHYGTNYQFSFDKMLDPKGDTAVYLLYNYARICSIFSKSDIILNKDNINIEITSDYERSLLLHIIKFSDIIELILQKFEFHR